MASMVAADNVRKDRVGKSGGEKDDASSGRPIKENRLATFLPIVVVLLPTHCHPSIPDHFSINHTDQATGTP